MGLLEPLELLSLPLHKLLRAFQLLLLRHFSFEACWSLDWTSNAENRGCRLNAELVMDLVLTISEEE